MLAREGYPLATSLAKLTRKAGGAGGDVAAEEKGGWAAARVLTWSDSPSLIQAWQAARL